MELAICEPDPELTQLISGGLLLRKNLGTYASPDRKSIGWSSPATGDDPAGNGVAIECWSHAIIDGKKAATLPYFHWVFPYAKLRLSGDRVIENGLLANTFEGYGLGNTEFGSGLDERWEYPVATERPYSYARNAWAPTGRKGFYRWHPEITKTVSNVARTSTTATITTSTAHTLEVGDSVVITGLTNTALNGTYTITAVPTTTTFTYTTTSSGTIASGADSGTAVVATNSRAVTDFTSQGSTTAYNVPGNEDYNADNAVDFILASTEDPTS
jgi:asparagine N-glycosylation enzyme membrane subunit Stt3